MAADDRDRRGGRRSPQIPARQCRRELVHHDRGEVARRATSLCRHRRCQSAGLDVPLRRPGSIGALIRVACGIHCRRSGAPVRRTERLARRPHSSRHETYRARASMADGDAGSNRAYDHTGTDLRRARTYRFDRIPADAGGECRARQGRYAELADGGRCGAGRRHHGDYQAAVCHGAALHGRRKRTLRAIMARHIRRGKLDRRRHAGCLWRSDIGGISALFHRRTAARDGRLYSDKGGVFQFHHARRSAVVGGYPATDQAAQGPGHVRAAILRAAGGIVRILHFVCRSAEGMALPILSDARARVTRACVSLC